MTHVIGKGRFQPEALLCDGMIKGEKLGVEGLAVHQVYGFATVQIISYDGVSQVA